MNVITNLADARRDLQLSKLGITTQAYRVSPVLVMIRHFAQVFQLLVPPQDLRNQLEFAVDLGRIWRKSLGASREELEQVGEFLCLQKHLSSDLVHLVAEWFAMCTQHLEFAIDRFDDEEYLRDAEVNARARSAAMILVDAAIEALSDARDVAADAAGQM